MRSSPRWKTRRRIGQVVELGGPKVYTLRELVRLAGRYSGHPRPVFGLPPALARMQAWFFEHAAGRAPDEPRQPRLDASR